LTIYLGYVNIPDINTNRKNNMIQKNDEMNLYKMCHQLADMIGKSAESTQKLGGVVEQNTNHINDLAVKLLALEKRLDSKK